MPVPREAFHELILDALRDSLADIRGDGGETYWYTPGAVVRCTWWAPKLLDTTIEGPIYAIRAGDETHSENAEGDSLGENRVLLEVLLLVAVLFKEVENPHSPPDPTRERIVSRMVQDVVRKLLADVQLLNVTEITDAGGQVENVFDEGLVVDRDKAEPGVAAAELRFTVSYRYTEGRP